MELKVEAVGPIVAIQQDIVVSEKVKAQDVVALLRYRKPMSFSLDQQEDPGIFFLLRKTQQIQGLFGDSAALQFSLHLDEEFAVVDDALDIIGDLPFLDVEQTHAFVYIRVHVGQNINS